MPVAPGHRDPRIQAGGVRSSAQVPLDLRAEIAHAFLVLDESAKCDEAPYLVAHQAHRIVVGDEHQEAVAVRAERARRAGPLHELHHAWRWDLGGPVGDR